MFDVLSLIGGGLGGAMRVVPEVMKLLQAKDERKHELAMTKVQLEIDAQRSKGQIDVLQAQGENSDIAGQQAIFLEAIKSQGQLTGVKWIDALNATVRPVITYWWLLLFTTYKIATLCDAWGDIKTANEFGDRIWDANDW
jgi:hypothetical protein